MLGLPLQDLRLRNAVGAEGDGVSNYGVNVCIICGGGFAGHATQLTCKACSQPPASPIAFTSMGEYAIIDIINRPDLYPIHDFNRERLQALEFGSLMAAVTRTVSCKILKVDDLIIFPARKLTVAVLTNLQGAGPEQLSLGVAGFFK